MKKCPSCGSSSPDTSKFCTNCGSAIDTSHSGSQSNDDLQKDDSSTEQRASRPLDDSTLKSHNTKRAIIAVVVAVCSGLLCFTIWMVSSSSSTASTVLSNRSQKAYETEKAKPSTSDMRVVDYTSRKSSSGKYRYLTGTVKNTSSNKTISYYEVGVKFYDSAGSVVGSDYTNSGTDLGPGESREFEIMYEYSSKYKSEKVFIQTVR